MRAIGSRVGDPSPHVEISWNYSRVPHEPAELDGRAVFDEWHAQSADRLIIEQVHRDRNGISDYQGLINRATQAHGIASMKIQNPYRVPNQAVANPASVGRGVAGVRRGKAVGSCKRYKYNHKRQ
jgi:hypothetical protein